MFELKKIHRDAIPAALERIERYRLLNEPRVAESIALDILEVDPDHEEALIGLLLALTDQFHMEGSSAKLNRRAHQLVPRLKDEFHRLYYTGIIHEREGKARLNRGYPGAGFDAYELLHRAMDCFAKADPLEDKDSDDAVLRWNSCARIVMDNNLTARPHVDEPVMSE